jgi:hypothetical protein
MAFPTGWGKSHEIQIQASQVSGSADHTDFPVLLNEDNFLAEVFTNTNGGDYSLDLELSSSQYAVIADASQTGLDITGDLSIEAWIKIESAPGSGVNYVIAGKANSTTNNRSYFFDYINDSGTNKLRLLISSAGTTFGFNAHTVTFTAGVWYHVAATYDASAGAVEYYINGSNVASKTGYPTSIFSGSADFIIGAYGNTTRSSFFDGILRNVRVWDDIRTASEISADMNTNTPADTTNLQGNWLLNNDCTDETANANDLTATGSPVFVIDTPFDGGDLRFSSDEAGTMQLSCQIVDWNIVANEAQVWVKVPTLQYDVDTSIYVWYDKTDEAQPAADAAFGSESVWNTNFKGVWHMEEASGTRVDSTSNDNDLADNNTVTSGTGQIDTGADFELTNSERLTITDAAQTGLDLSTDFIFAGWFKVEQLPSTAGTIFMLISKYVDTTERSYIWYIETGDVTALNFYNTGVVSRAVTNAAILEAGDVGTMVHLAAKVDISGPTFTFFKNGAAVASTLTNSTATTIKNSTAGVGVGARLDATPVQYYDGIMDELYIVSNLYSDDWITTIYNNQSNPSTFALAISPEPEVVPTSSITLNDLKHISTTQLQAVLTLDKQTTVTEVGVVVGTSSAPDTTDSVFKGATNTGEQTIDITGLDPDTRYYIRPYFIE